MQEIAISYRRRDSQAITGRIRDRVARHFGENSVFMDIDNIPLGIDFRKHIEKALRESQLLLVIIGPNWIGRVEGAQARICDPMDFVRIEVEVALRRSIPVIPVLVDGATMPSPSALPGSLKDLPFFNAAQVSSGVDFHPHVDRLVRAMEQIFEERSPVMRKAQTEQPQAQTVPARQTRLFGGRSGLIACVVLFAFVSAYHYGLLERLGFDPKIMWQPAPSQPGNPRGKESADVFGEEVTFAAKPIIYREGTATWDTAFDTLVDAFKSVQGFVDREKLKPAGPFMTIYTATDDTGFHFQAGLLLEEEPKNPPEGDLTIGKSPDGRALKFVHRGSYDAMDATFDAITKYLDDNKLEAKDLFIEQYVSDPLTTPQDKLVIDIYVPVQ
jgi:effector-binding domain-containing protein